MRKKYSAISRAIHLQVLQGTEHHFVLPTYDQAQETEQLRGRSAFVTFGSRKVYWHARYGKRNGSKIRQRITRPHK